MAEAPGDWKVTITLDRKAIVEEITELVHMLARQRVAVIVSASSQDEALEMAKARLQAGFGTPM